MSFGYALRRVAAATLAVTLSLAFVSVPAFAEVTQADIDAAKAELDRLDTEYAVAADTLSDTLGAIEQTDRKTVEVSGQIDTETQELRAKQGALSEYVASNYKFGIVNFLEILLNSSTFEEFSSNIYYAVKTTQSVTETIEATRELKARLEADRNELSRLKLEQEQLAEDQKAQLATLEEKQTAQQSYIDALTEELRAQIEAERQRQIEAEQAAAQAALEENQQQNAYEQPSGGNAAADDDSGSSGGGNSSSSSSSGGGSSSYGGGSSSYGGGSSYSGGSLTAGQRQAIVSAAYSQLGLPYSHVCEAGVGWDCSGLVGWAYTQAGLPTTYYSVTQISMAGAHATSNPQPGDVVCWMGNVPGGNYSRHVAIYIGGGQILHANGSRVAVDSLGQWSPYSWIGPLY